MIRDPLLFLVLNLVSLTRSACLPRAQLRRTSNQSGGDTRALEGKAMEIADRLGSVQERWMTAEGSVVLVIDFSVIFLNSRNTQCSRQEKTF
jgi:hypothetical protein